MRDTMGTSRDSYRTAPGQRRRASGGPERGLALSGLIRTTLLSVQEREQARGRLINIIILAQALLTIALAPAYLGSHIVTGPLAAVCATLVVYLLAFACNSVFHRPTTAAYVLIAGGIIGVFAQGLLPALGGHSVPAAQASLLFTAIILETGLLFAPEVTLITAAATAALTAFIILFALSQEKALDKHEAYLLVVYTLGLQALSGLIAWLLAQFIYESAIEAQQGQATQFAQARLEAAQAQLDDMRDRIDQGIGAIQATITHAIAGDYHSRAPVTIGELSPVAETLNVLLQRVEAVTQAEQMQSRIQAAALPLIDAIARMNDSGGPTPPSLSIVTNTPMDSVTVAVSHMQANVAQRLARVQKLVGEVVGALGHSQDGLNGASEAVQEGYRMAGALKSATEEMLTVAHRQLGILLQARRMLAAVLPPEITQTASDIARERQGGEGGSGLVGLARDLGIATPGGTGEFDVMQGTPGAGIPGFAPLTIPLPIVESEGSGAPGTAERDGALPAELVDVWNLTGQLDAESAHLERSLTQLSRDLSMQSRHMRSADANIAWFRQALDAVRSNAEQLQQIAGPMTPLPASDLGPASRPLEPGALGRPGQPSRPLADYDNADDGTLAALGRPSGPYASPELSRPSGPYTPPAPARAPEQEPPATRPAPEDDFTGPATGSMRVADLLDLDGLNSSGSRFSVPVDAPHPGQGDEG